MPATAIDGVPGSHAPVPILFRDIAGSMAGALLPTGRARDEIDGVECTLIDNGMPCVLMRAADLGLTGRESREALEADEALRARIEAIPLKAGPLMNLGDVRDASVPKMTLLSPPAAGGTIGTRSFIPHRAHASIGVFAAVSVATGCIVPGSVAEGLARLPEGGTFSIEHPSGAAEVFLDIAADGSLRDALSLLDQAASHGNGRLEESEVAAMLGTVDREHAVRLLDAVVAGDGPRVLAEMASLDERVPDYDDVLGTLAALLQRAAVLQAAPEIEDDEDGLTARARPFAHTAAPEDLQLWYQVSIAGRRDLPLAPSPRAGCEMVLLRMLAFRYAAPGETGSAVEPARPAARSAAPAATVSARTGADTATPAPGAVPATTAAPAGVPTATPATGGDEWERLVDAMSLGGATRQLARHCTLAGREGGVIRLVMDPAHEIFATPAQQERLREALATHLGEPVRLQLQLARPTVETPADRERRAAADRQREAEAAIEADPLVREMQRAFDATVDRDSIRPAD